MTGCILMMWAAIQAPILTCDCLAPTPEGALQAAAVIFVGTVRSIEPVHIADGKVKKGGDPNGSPVTWRAVKFRVVEAFKGVSSSRVVIISSAPRCEIGFELGQTYLVYAHSSGYQPGFLTTTGCDRTYNIERGGDEVKWLREQVKPPAN